LRGEIARLVLVGLIGGVLKTAIVQRKRTGSFGSLVAYWPISIAAEILNPVERQRKCFFPGARGWSKPVLEE